MLLVDVNINNYKEFECPLYVAKQFDVDLPNYWTQGKLKNKIKSCQEGMVINFEKLIASKVYIYIYIYIHTHTKESKAWNDI